MTTYEQYYESFLKENKSISKFCSERHIDKSRFSKFIKSKGFIVINKQNNNGTYSDIFNKIDTEEKAYWLGFLYADGSVASQKDGKKKRYDVEISLKVQDYEHLRKFKEFLNSPNKISLKKIGKYEAVRFAVNNKKIYESLVEKGCTPKKSLTIQFPDKDIVPDNLIKHFVRGYIDGDGYIGFKTNDKTTGRLSITTGSKNFLIDLINKMNWEQKQLKEDYRSIHITYAMEWCNKKVYYMLKELYDDATIYLNRKYDLYIELKNAVLSQAEKET